jgi:stearoyl-CoA desaturase (delta-9 desaturase)
MIQAANVRADADHTIDWPTTIPFIVVHLAAVAGVAKLGWSLHGFALAVAIYYVRMFGVTAGYHRYFSHRSFKTSRPLQFALAVLSMSSSQKGVLWWAAHHRTQHKHSDQPGDVHSVLWDGFLWGHLGWLFARKNEPTDEARVRDLSRFPELVWLNRWWWLPPAALGAGLFLVGGWFTFVWGFLASTVFLWHGTFSINSLTHMFGRRRYVTRDNSRNSAILAVVTLGEGRHNNHHYYAASTRQGFFWWEFDPTYYVLWLLELAGIVHDLRCPSASILWSNRVSAAP